MRGTNLGSSLFFIDPATLPAKIWNLLWLEGWLLRRCLEISLIRSTVTSKMCGSSMKDCPASRSTFISKRTSLLRVDRLNQENLFIMSAGSNLLFLSFSGHKRLLVYDHRLMPDWSQETSKDLNVSSERSAFLGVNLLSREGKSQTGLMSQRFSIQESYVLLDPQ